MRLEGLELLVDQLAVNFLDHTQVDVLADVPEDGLVVSIAGPVNLRGLGVRYAAPIDASDKISPLDAANTSGHVLVEFYPDVNLTAFIGFQTLGAGNLITAGNREIGVGPAVTLPIFDAGRRRGNLAARDSAYDIAVEQYNQAVADGLREVVDQLTSFRSVGEQQVQQHEGLATAQDAYDLATLRYREGVGNYLQGLTTETQLLSQRGLDADLRARSLDTSINLARALGGGFDNPALAQGLPSEH